jgi:hypothetical protein
MKVKELYEYFTTERTHILDDNLSLKLDEKNHYLRIIDENGKTVYAIVEDHQAIEAADILTAVNKLYQTLVSRNFKLVEWTDNDLYFLKFYDNDLMFVAYLSHFPKISLELSIGDIVHRHVFNSESLKYRTSSELEAATILALNPFWSKFYSAVAWLSKTSRSSEILKRKGYKIVESDSDYVLYNLDLNLRLEFKNNDDLSMLDQFEINHACNHDMYRGIAIIELVQVQSEKVSVTDRVRLKIPVYIKRESMLEYIEEHLKNAGYLEDL